MRLIDADAFSAQFDGYGWGEECDGLKVLAMLDEAPTIDAEPVRHGRWISEKCNHKPCRIKNPEKWVTYKCSVCGYSNGRKQSNYCPNCGAKMDKEE